MKNIAVVGCGHWGKNLVRNFAELGSLFAICDPNTNIADIFSKKYNIQNLSFEEILNNPNITGVVLAIPAPLHASFAINGMNAGKHIFVEKPIAMNTNEANQMIEASKKNNVYLMVGHLLQYHPVFIKTLDLVKAGNIGDINYIYSNRLSLGKVRSQEDVIWSFAPHDISMLLALANNEEVDTVFTESKSIIQKDISDTSIIHLNFMNGLKAHIFVSWLHPYKEHKLVVIGTKGIIVFDDTKPWKEKLVRHNHTIQQSEDIIEINQTNHQFIDVIESEPLRDECVHFMDVVNNNIKPLTSGDEGLKVLNILAAASKSICDKKTIKINEL